jgi:hypothetical protein
MGEIPIIPEIKRKMKGENIKILVFKYTIMYI